MKILLISLTFISFILNAKAYEVLNKSEKGYTVTANNFVYITTPKNKSIKVTSLPFVGEVNGYSYSMPPVKPIYCTWDPSHTWLGIFITVRQITEIHFFDLKSEFLLKVDSTYYKYPPSFNQKQLFAHITPIEWKDNKLLVDTLVKFRDGNTKHYPVTISINGNTFTIMPDRKEK